MSTSTVPERQAPPARRPIPRRQVTAALLAIVCLLAGSFLAPPLQPHISVWQAVWLVMLFLASAWVPGYLLDEWLYLSGQQVTPASPAVWLALSCGLLAPAGWVVLAFHTPLKVFGWLAALVTFGALLPHLIRRRTSRPFVWPFGRQDRVWLVIAGILILTLLGLTAWAPEDADNWTYNAYIREYVSTNAVNAAHPSFGEGIPDNPRMRYNVWLVFQAFLARGVGLDPGYAFVEPFKLLMALMTAGAAYTLAAGLFRTPGRALRATAIYLALLFLASGFREPGSQVMAIINYDKSAATRVLMPVGWYLVLSILERTAWRKWAGLFLLGAGLSALHAEVLMLLVISYGFLLAALFLLRHPMTRLKRAAGAVAGLLPWTGFVFITAWLYTQRGPAPGSEAWELLHQANLAQGRIRFLGGSSWFIVESSLVLYPLLVVSLLLTPLLLSRSLREKPAAALLLGNQIGPLVLMFLPGLPNLMARFTEYNTLWRIGWICMPAFTIAYILDAYEEWWRPWWQKLAGGFRRILPPVVRYSAGVLIGAVCLAGLVWASVSAMRREIIGRPARQWIPSPGLYETLAPLEPAVTAMGAPMVLASADEISQIPSLWPFARVLATRRIRGTLPSFPPDRQEEALARLRLVNALGTVPPWDRGWLDSLRDLGVDLLVVNRQDLAGFEDQLAQLPAMYVKLAGSSTHSVYLVQRDVSTPLGMVAAAQAAMLRGQYDETCRLFRQSHENHPDFVMATIGTAWCAERAGETAKARELYREALTALETTPAFPANTVPALSHWMQYFPILSVRLHQALMMPAASFAAERLAYLEARLTGDSSTEWVAGWPRQGVRAPAGTLTYIPMARPEASPIRLTLRAEGTGRSPVFCTLLGERLDGDLRGWASTLLYPGEEREVELPALTDERLWLQAQSRDAGGACVIYGWHRAMNEIKGLILSPEVEELASWLVRNLPGMEPALAGPIAQALVQMETAETNWLIASLAAQNLVRDAHFAQGTAGAWKPIFAHPSARLVFSPDEAGDFTAVAAGDEAVYYGGWCQTLEVTPRREYLYLVRLTAQLEGGAVFAGYWDFQRLGKFRSSSSRTLKQTTGWMVVPAFVQVPAGVRSLSICPALLKGPGEVRVDWAWFVPLDVLRGD